uniref:hypothetical protein n=1 Tax=Escherichia coli TaxID=562 RepID=UPI00289B24DA
QYDSANMSLLLDNLSKYRTFVDYWTQSDNYGNKINTDAFQTKIIEENQKLTETLTNPKNKELIVEYQKNSESIKKHQLALSRN